MTSEPLLRVRELRKYFPVRGGVLRRPVASLKAVDGVSFDLPRGSTFGLVGESGCGKSTLGRAILRLQHPTSGSVILDGTDITALSPAELLPWRRRMQIIFQDPYASLSPRRTVRQTIREALDTHRIGTAAERDSEVERLLEVVGLRRQVLDRYPHEFSGGQRQRVGIARALALSPDLIVADEPVSALDVSVQSQVLNLIADLQREQGIAFLFISHDLAVVQHISDVVGVMYLGKLVETANAETIYSKPLHPYTQALMAAVPVPDPSRSRQRLTVSGEVPSAISPPPGCPFHPRCPQAMPVCSKQAPALVDQASGGRHPHLVSCHLYTDPDAAAGQEGSRATQAME